LLPGFQTLAVQSTTHERSGHAMSTFFIFYDLGIASGAFIWGIVISGSGFTAMYIIGAILILITAYVLYLWLSKQEKQKETKQEEVRTLIENEMTLHYIRKIDTH